VEKEVMSGSSDPMAIPLTPFERQFLDFGNAVKNRTTPLVSGEEGLKALEVVLGVYESCRSGQPVRLG
jgi:predicted dehydrogenase